MQARAVHVSTWLRGHHPPPLPLSYTPCSHKPFLCHDDIKLGWVLSFSLLIVEMCVYVVCVLRLSVDVDMSVCVVVVSAWLHHCVVHWKLPALSSKLWMLYVTNSAFRTHKCGLQYAVFEPFSWQEVKDRSKNRCIQCHFHVKGGFHGDKGVFFFLSHWIVVNTLSRWVLHGVVHAHHSVLVNDVIQSAAQHQCEWPQVVR